MFLGMLYIVAYAWQMKSLYRTFFKPSSFSAKYNSFQFIASDHYKTNHWSMRVRNFMFAGHVYDCPAMLCVSGELEFEFH